MFPDFARFLGCVSVFLGIPAFLSSIYQWGYRDGRRAEAQPNLDREINDIRDLYRETLPRKRRRPGHIKRVK